MASTTMYDFPTFKQIPMASMSETQLPSRPLAAGAAKKQKIQEDSKKDTATLRWPTEGLPASSNPPRDLDENWPRIRSFADSLIKKNSAQTYTFVKVSARELRKRTPLKSAAEEESRVSVSQTDPIDCHASRRQFDKRRRRNIGDSSPPRRSSFPVPFPTYRFQHGLTSSSSILSSLCLLVFLVFFCVTSAVNAESCVVGCQCRQLRGGFYVDCARASLSQVPEHVDQSVVGSFYRKRPGDCPGNDMWAIYGNHVSEDECRKRCDANKECQGKMTLQTWNLID